MSLTIGQFVEHRVDLALGQGRVIYEQVIAGVTQVGVIWTSATQPVQHTLEELAPVLPLPERMAEAGPASRIPFQLKVFGRWFEARHGLTGELSNQPFQMLPHQVVVTNRVVNSAPDNRRWLIADDVGLGKTIEAGMIMEVLRKKALGRFRCLIVTPAGLMPQWQDELSTRFRRNFRIFGSRFANDLETVDQLLVSIDTLKMPKFRPAVQTATAWDLVIFDEAHHLATTPNVQSYQLALAMRVDNKARNLLFLTATPHSGNNEHFFNMLRLLRDDLFPKGEKDYPHVPLKQVMLRNRKSDVTDARRQKIFKGIAPAKIITFAPTKEEVAFYEDLQGYLRTGYKVADRLQKQKDVQKASAVGFVMSTFGKLASSSRAAIESALRNRVEALGGETEVEALLDASDERFPGEEAAARVKSQAIENTTVRGKKRKVSLIEGELGQVESLLKRLNALQTPDSKLGSFMKRVRDLPVDLKVLIFTEYRATQRVLVEQLKAHFGNECVATINGSMKMAERRLQVDAFNERRPDPRFMVSTEAGGEGLNMQKSCHTIVNYDLPWNPMALQQRIGRVYRYGQHHPVVVLNLKVDSSSEAFADQRICEYLERKIDEITRKLQEVQDGDPEDLRGEVLGQVANQISFDDLYKTAVEEGRVKAERAIDDKALHIEEIMADPKGMLGVFKGLDRFDISDYEKVATRVTSPHLEFFIRQYLGYHGSPVKVSTDHLLSFSLPKKLVDVANDLAKADPYQARETLTNAPIERATVDKEIAQQTLGSRLLRFGDTAFEAMVRHVQHGGFAAGVASLELSASALGWDVGVEGTWLLFDLRIVRGAGSAGGGGILRSELTSYVVPRGGALAERDAVVEVLHEALDGPLQIDAMEAQRAYAAARKLAEERLSEMYQQVVGEYENKLAIMPLEVQDIGMAWVKAV